MADVSWPKVIKVQIRGGQATPAPPLGPALGQAGVNIKEFCDQFNEATEDRKGQIVPTVITVEEDRSFTFVLKQPPASALIMEALKIEKGSGLPHKEKVGTLQRCQLEEIAKLKMPDLNTTNLSAAMKIIAGTARQMGVEVEGM
jgi:large subunit ribosomal protein L11